VTYHAFQAMSDVNRRLVIRIGPTKIAVISPSNLEGCFNLSGLTLVWMFQFQSYMEAAVSPIATFCEPIKSMHLS